VEISEESLSFRRLSDHAMRRFRFHIGTLVILVLLLGVGFAARRESNETWDSNIFSLTLGMLTISILVAIHRTEKRRAFWLGFARFGSAYLGLSQFLSIESRLLTTKVLFYVNSKVPRSIPAGIAFYGSMDLYVGVGPDGQRSDAFNSNKSDGKYEEEKVATFAVARSNPNMLEGKDRR